jgi:hypothetical protein
MRIHMGLCALLTVALMTSGLWAADDSADRMNKFEQRLNELEKKHTAELKARDEEIARLRAIVEKLSPPTTRGSDIDKGREGALKQLESPTTKPSDIEKAKRDVLADIDSRRASEITKRIMANFNPDLAVVSDLVASYSRDRNNDALNRIDVREVELDLRAAVDPRADGVAILAFARDADNPVFPTAEGPSGPDTSVSIEEAYLFLHDFGVPNLTAKLGRFHLRFGRQNVLHSHDLPTTDAPFVNQAFLAPEALTDAGLSLSYVIPNPWNQYFEVITEIISGEGANAASPTLHGDLSVDSPALNTHFLWNTDIGKDWNLELGTSYLMGHADRDNSLDVRLFGGDATLIHTDPTGRFNNQLIQAELIYGNVDQPRGNTADSLGAYLLVQQQLNRDWYTGVRLDWTEDANNDKKEAWGVSPYVSWYWSEFLRFRVEYQHKDGDVPNNDIVFFQATWIFGAHPPHPYWAMK